MEFGDWEDSYNELLRWLQAIQESLPGTIVKYGVSPYVMDMDGVREPSICIFKRVF